MAEKVVFNRWFYNDFAVVDARNTYWRTTSGKGYRIQITELIKPLDEKWILEEKSIKTESGTYLMDSVTPNITIEFLKRIVNDHNTALELRNK